MFKTVPTALWLSSSSLCILWACSQKEEDGFGGGGSSFDPVTDTGPWYSKEDTGPSDTGSADTDTDTAQGSDTGDSDSADTGEGPVIVGTGYARGDTAYALDLKDQDEDDWSLHAQYGKIVVLVFGEAWDSRFDTISAYLPELEETYDIVAAPVLLTDMAETAADEEDAEEWAGKHSLDTVLWDPSIAREVQTSWAPLVRPRLFLIDNEMTIQWVSEGITNKVQLSEKIEDLVF